MFPHVVPDTMSGWQFPQWNYGYTQMPSYFMAPPHPGLAPTPSLLGGRPAFPAIPHLPTLHPHPAAAAVRTVAAKPLIPTVVPKAAVQTTVQQTTAVKVEVPVTTPTTTTTSPPVVKAEPVVKEDKKAAKNTTKPEEGEIVEKSVLGILKGRNPVMFCNDQSKLRGLQMEWEQVSEIGPPHDKTYEYQLKMGDMTASGIGKNKKDAKTKAAENMVLKLDELPRINKRPYHPVGWGSHPGWGQHQGGMGRGGYHHHGGMGSGGPAWKKRKGEGRETEDAILKKNDITPKTENPSQNNPISRLYEYAKKRRWPEPIFDCISEEVLEERRTENGFTLRKTNFCLRCTVRMPPGQGEDATYVGTALTKKQAKTNAAQAAWAQLGGGVTPKSVESLLSEARSGDTDSTPPISTSSPSPVSAAPSLTPAQPRIRIHKQPSLSTKPRSLDLQPGATNIFHKF